ncbi:MAG: alpha/beta hydrolase [Cyclobacteriaceae bacterium]|nr:alpha/beta hydrolase [Cyclobacteriaceae bacterium]
MKGIFIKLFSLTLFVASSNFLLASVNIQTSVDIGGIKQWISIKGANDSDPVLLFLHGGPGNSVMSYADKFTNDLQKHFIVVQWDQREAGTTAKLNASNQPLTVALMEEDARELVDYLRLKFSRDKIFLMGHSWGGFLGLKLAADHPDLFEAYFAVSPMVYQDESEQRSLAWMKEKGKGNTQELKELAMVRIPFQSVGDLYYHRKWLAVGMGSKAPFKAFVESWDKKWLGLFLEASKVNFFEVAPEIKCPIYFFVGKRDYQTHSGLTEEYYKMLKAGKKDLFWFTNSAHNLNLTESRKFQQIVISLKSKN